MAPSYLITSVAFLMLWTCVLFVMMWLRDTPTFQDSSAPSCFDSEGCRFAHMQNPELKRILNNRCIFGNETKKKSKFNKITFTHIPKSGGSSLKDFFAKNAPGRLRKGDHEHFVDSAREEPDNVFVTLLREPVAKAISFFSYVKDCSKFPEDEKNNKLWTSAHSMEPVAWSADPSVQKHLAVDPIGYFLPDVANISEIQDTSTKASYANLRNLPPVTLRKTPPSPTLERFLHYTKNFPEAYQCKRHMEVAYILLRHYEVVGTVENLDIFYHVLHDRAQIPISKEEKIHLNRSKFQHKVLGATERAEMERNLKGPLFCSTILWRIADLISTKDNLCLV